jgi:FemAB-related protein (PEP-CTERM system-associated)
MDIALQTGRRTSDRLVSWNTHADVDIVLCGTEGRENWDAYVARSPSATICHHFLWQTIIARAYHHQPFYLLALSGAQVRGLLPLFVVKSRLFGKSLTSMPFLDYGGVCADNQTVSQQLQQTALQLTQVCGADYVELRQCEPPVQSGRVRTDKVGMVLDLSPGAAALWQAFPAKVRNQVRKAEGAGLRAVVGGAELLDEFYTVFAVNMRALGSPVHHRVFFAQIFSEFGEQAKLVVVREGRETVGGLVCLFFKDTVTVPWASSLRTYFSKCPNNLLYWEAIRYACARDCRRFDFGRSSLGSGTYNFKRQWGAEQTQIYWQVLSRKDISRGTAFSVGSPKYRLVLEMWKHLPLALTKLIGPHLRKYLTN